MISGVSETIRLSPLFIHDPHTHTTHNNPPHTHQNWTPNWHVVIGKNFGSFVTHETRCFLYFYTSGLGDVSADPKAVMMYKAG